MKQMRVLAALAGYAPICFGKQTNQYDPEAAFLKVEPPAARLETVILASNEKEWGAYLVDGAPITKGRKQRRRKEPD